MKWLIFGILMYAATYNAGYTQILWEEHFDNPGSFSESQFAHYKEGVYHIYGKNGRVSYFKDREFANAAIQVKTEFIGKEEGKGYGVIFRALDYDNFYVFGISGNGFYFFAKEIKDKFVSVIAWTESEVINKKGVNFLAVNCDGPAIELFINGIKVNQVTDKTFRSGKAGLIAYNDVHAHFDDLIVFQNRSGLATSFQLDPEPVHTDYDFSSEQSHLYYYNFDVMNEEWSQSEHVYYERGYYTMWNQNSDHYTWHSFSGKNYTMEANIKIGRWPEGLPESQGGILVRMNKNIDFYGLAVLQDDRVILKKRTNEFDQVLHEWKVNDLYGIIRLKLSADNDQLHCWVNDQFLGTASDPSEPHAHVDFGFFATKGVQLNIYSVNLTEIKIDWVALISAFFLSPVFIVIFAVVALIIIVNLLGKTRKRKQMIEKLRRQIIQHIEKNRGTVTVTSVMMEYNVDLKTAKAVMNEACLAYKGHHLISQDGNDCYDFPEYFSGGKG